MRALALDLKSRLGDKPAVIALIAEDGTGKTPFVVAATKAGVAQGVKANDLAKVLGSYIQGNGGGKPDMAQGSARDIAGFDSGVAAIKDEIRN
ncbi:DHHA1 domain-containing protein [Corynebacterium pseudotuberculosis]|uniref:DHHA1 domain-containing protein n=1 Tax=Corynebacterium pseudotuberculosis TaxID=1719 RepID=UPI000A7F1DCE